MDGIYTNSLNLRYQEEITDKGKEKTAPAFQTGDIIEGTITSVTDRVSINFSGKEYSFPCDTVQNAREGEIRTYKIMEASGASFVLKEIGNAASAQGQGGLLFTTVDTGAQVFQEPAELKESRAKEDEEHLDGIANRMTEEDYCALKEEGMTLEKYEMERLDRVLERMKLQTQLKHRAVEGQKEDLRNQRRMTEEAAKKNAVRLNRDAMAQKIAERLVAANLPVTESNVNRIADAMNLAEEAQFMTEASFSYLIANRLQPTIENCYRAVHSGAVRTETVPDEVFQELLPQIETLAEEAGLKNVKDAFADARWLMEKELPLTAENLQYKKELDELQGAIKNSLLTKEVVLEGTVQTLSDRGEPKQTNLSLLRKKEEARLQMTEEAADRMKKVGVEADTDAIRKRIEELKAEEEEFFRKQLAEEPEVSSGRNAEEAAELFTKTLRAAESVRNSSVRILARTFENRNAQTLRSLADAADAQSNSAEAVSSAVSATGRRAQEGYEALMTSPRKDMGDSIQRAFRHIDSQLEAMELPVTEANRRAVRILGYNSIPLTEENITQMKYYDAQVTGLMENLQPEVTMNLIRRGINPLAETVASLSKEAEALAKELGTKAEERFSEYLVKLERKHELTAEERESYIGIYRMLYQIEKTDGAAVGALVKSGRELTLKNLLTESRTRKSKGIEARVDDAFGVTAERTFAAKNIDEQIETAYQRSCLERVEKNLTPDRLQEVMREQDITELTPEQLDEALDKAAEGHEDVRYRNEQLQNLRELARDSISGFRFLERFGIGNSISRLQAAEAYLQNRNPYRMLSGIGRKRAAEDGNSYAELTEPLNLQEDEVTQALGSREALSQICENAVHSANVLMEQLYMSANLNAEEAVNLREIGASLELRSLLVRKECYDIPLYDESGITGLRLTVVHGAEGEGRFRISMNAENESVIRVDAELRNGKMHLLIVTDNRKLYDSLKADRQELEGRLEQAGADVGQINFGYSKVQFTDSEPDSYPGRPAGDREENGNEAEEAKRTKTAVLYTAAKETVLFIRKGAMI